MVEVADILVDACTYGFYVWESEALTEIGNKSKKSSSKNTSEQNRKNGKGQIGEHMKIVLFSVTDMADAMSIENGTAVIFCVFNVSDCHRSNLFVSMELIEEQDIPIRNVSLLHLTSFRDSLLMYGFNYSNSTLSRTFHTGVSANDVTRLSTGGMTADRRILRNGESVLLIKGRHPLQWIRQLYMEADIAWREQHVLAHLKPRAKRVIINKAEGIKLSRLVNKVNRTVRRN